MAVTHKVVQRLQRLWDLPLRRTAKRPRKSGLREVITAAAGRVNLLIGRQTIGPLEVFSTDFTELVYGSGRAKAELIAIVDHTTKLVAGWAVGQRATTQLALQAWQRAKRRLRQLGRWREDLIVHQDQDAVFTGYGWTGQLLLRDRVRLSYAVRGARDNPEMESFFGRFKTENHSLFLDARTLAELAAVLRDRIDYYNRERRHSALGYWAPLKYVHSLRKPG